MPYSSHVGFLLVTILTSHVSGEGTQKTLPVVEARPNEALKSSKHLSSNLLVSLTSPVLPAPTEALQTRHLSLGTSLLQATPSSTVDRNSTGDTPSNPYFSNKNVSNSEKSGNTIKPGVFLAIILCIVVLVTAAHFKVGDRLREVSCVGTTSTRARSVVLLIKKYTEKMLPGVLKSSGHREHGPHHEFRRPSVVKITLPLVSRGGEAHMDSDVS